MITIQMMSTHNKACFNTHICLTFSQFSTQRDWSSEFVNLNMYSILVRLNLRR